MFYERQGKQIVRICSTLTVQDVMDKGNQIFATHHRYYKDMAKWANKELEPKPNPFNYLVRVK